MAPTEFLKRAWIEKRIKNPSYSLSAFARDLDVSQPHLTKILSGRRRLTPDIAFKIGQFLKLDEKQLLEFIVSTMSSQSVSETTRMQ